MSNSVDPDETAQNEPSHLDLRCLQKPIIIAYGSERIKETFPITRRANTSVWTCRDLGKSTTQSHQVLSRR